MSVRATVTTNDGSPIHLLKASWHDLTLWMAEHHGEYTAVKAQEVSAATIKQGREPG